MHQPSMFYIHNNKTSIAAATSAGFHISKEHPPIGTKSYLKVSMLTKYIYPEYGGNRPTTILYPNQILEMGLMPDYESRKAYMDVLKEEHRNQ